MRRLDKETFEMLKEQNLMETYNYISREPAGKLVKLWEKTKETDNAAVDGLCNLMLTRAIKTAIGKEKAKKRKSPMTSITKP